ncbi:hypothetical protein L3Y34_018518 [Caenorhabditis briggsae]|uniref:Uncharacterized protein n=1 Tax=Caenorhabditis briggsae TaxID=6238 RepID=A0AAE9DLP3_CAEBR|nr:hypothetical protein L3Y34_018518 [Caenorhabditis briggsae]
MVLLASCRPRPDRKHFRTKAKAVEQELRQMRSSPIPYTRYAYPKPTSQIQKFNFHSSKFHQIILNSKFI